MKLLVALSFVTFASSASIERSPSFSLVGNRSDNGSPIIAVTFPNGHSDTLHLSHFDADVRDCRFNGHLLSDPETCLAVTGCPGQEDVELTILSEHAPGSQMYKWNKDGSVENLESPVVIFMFEETELGISIFLHFFFNRHLQIESNQSSLMLRKLEIQFLQLLKLQ
jgi:hypothetical protein